MNGRFPGLLLLAGTGALLAAAAILLRAGDRAAAVRPAPEEIAPTTEIATEPVAPAPVEARASTPQRVAVATGDGGNPSAPSAPPPARGTLRVSVRFADARAAAGVRVHAVPESASGPWTLGDPVAADAEGVARFQLTPGRYRVGTSLAGEGASIRANVDAGATTTVQILLRRGYTVAGTVVDVRQRPVEGASVWLTERWRDSRGDVVARTDADGRFRVEGILDQRLVSVTARRYAPSHQFRVEGLDGDTRELEFELRDDGAELRARVVDPRGRPVVSALVLVGSERVAYEARDETGRGVAGPLPRLLRADDEGRFAVDGLRAGAAHVQVRADGFAPFAGELAAVPRGGAEQILSLQPEAVLFGVVRDTDSRAVAGGEVSAGGADAFAAASARTDDTGAYELRGLPGATVEVVARRQGQGEARVRVAVVAGARTEWNPLLELPRRDAGRTLSGVVVDVGGAPQTRLLLSIRDGADTTEAGPQARTDDAGAFTVQVKWDVVRVVVQRDGPWRRFPLLVVDDVRPADGPVRLVVPDPATALGSIEGRVLGPDGSPQPARLTLWHEQARLWREFESTAEGLLRVEGVLPGDVQMEVRAQGHPWVVLGTRAVAAGQALQLGAIRLPQAGRISGTYTLPAGIEASALEFTIYRDRGPEGAVIQAGEGRFESGPLAPAEYEVRIQGRGVRTFNRRVTVDVAAISRLHADLERAVVRNITVVLAEGLPRPRWVTVHVRDRQGGLAWHGGLGPQGATGVEVSLVPGAYTVQLAGEGGCEGNAPLRVDARDDAEPVHVELRAPR